MTLNEDDIIQHLALSFATLPAGVRGIGDDAAVFPADGGRSYLVSTDILAENVHFRLGYFSPEDLAHKALHVNLSDITAMGARPSLALLSLSVPPHVDETWMRRFLDAFAKECKAQNVTLIGGDTTASRHDLFISVTAIGHAAPTQIKYRRGAKMGDVICVAGTLGEAGAGLALLEKNIAGFDIVKAKCLHPMALVEEGAWFALKPQITSMMDISDGLYTDLGRMMEKSGLGAALICEMLRPSPALAEASAALQKDVLHYMLTGGEDYALLFTVAANAWSAIEQDFAQKFHYKLQKIGIVNADKGITLMQNGAEVPFRYKSFSHFGEN